MKSLVITLLTLLVLSIGLLLLAAEPAGAQMAPPMFPSSPDQAPVDGGLALLAAAGGAYAIKKIRDRRKE